MKHLCETLEMGMNGPYERLVALSRRGVSVAPSRVADDKDNITLTDKASGLSLGYKTTAQPWCTFKQASKPTRTTSMKRLRRNKQQKSEPTCDGLLLDDCYNTQTTHMLEKISDWSFDVFALDKASNGRALFHVVLKLFQRHNLIEKFNLDMIKLMKFATLVEDGYRNNPYHNAVHAADVAQAMHYYITQGKIGRHMTPIEELVSIVAAITHDLDHPGVNQNFLIATNNHLAQLYENKAVLENHHWRAALGALHQSGLFDHLPRVVTKKIELEMRSLILATDMTRQQEFFTTLKSRVQNNDLNMKVYDDRHFILQIALKCADISNPCRHWTACKAWSEKVCQEFFRQGDFERDLSLPISNFCDKYTNEVPKIQTGFIDFVVEPLFREFERFMFPDTILGEQLANLQNNRQTWKLIQEKPATRPSTLPLISTVEAQVEIPEVPSPTESLESGSDLDECPSPAYDRRHSVPVLTLLEDSTILSRRQSFPDGQNYTRLNLNRAQKMYEVLLLDNVVRPDSNLTSVTNSGNNIAIAFEDIGSSTCSRSALVPASPHSMTYLLEGQ